MDFLFTKFGFNLAWKARTVVGNSITWLQMGQ